MTSWYTLPRLAPRARPRTREGHATTDHCRPGDQSPLPYLGQDACWKCGTCRDQAITAPPPAPPAIGAGHLVLAAVLGAALVLGVLWLRDNRASPDQTAANPPPAGRAAAAPTATAPSAVRSTGSTASGGTTVYRPSSQTGTVVNRPAPRTGVVVQRGGEPVTFPSMDGTGTTVNRGGGEPAVFPSWDDSSTGNTVWRGDVGPTAAECAGSMSWTPSCQTGR